MYSKILKYNIFAESKEELIKYIYKSNKIHVVSGNPEVLYTGLNDKKLYENFNDKKSVIIPDGVGVVIASKIVRQPVKEKIAGIEVMDEILRKCEKEDKGVYLLGTKQEILEECIKNLNKKLPNIKIVGSHNGFFDLNNCEDILEDISRNNPYAIFVAMGCPRQENFIVKYMDKLPCKIFMAVGGSFDVIAGKVKRAPRWMIALGLEWLYRVSKEPWRIKRLGSIPKFLLKVIKNTYIMKDSG